MKYMTIMDAQTNMLTVACLEHITQIQHQSNGHSKITYLNGNILVIAKRVEDMADILEAAGHEVASASHYLYPAKVDRLVIDEKSKDKTVSIKKEV